LRWADQWAILSSVICVRGLTLTITAAAVAALALAAASPAATVIRGEKQAFEAVKRAKLDPADAAAYRAEIRRAASLIRNLPRDRARAINVALLEVAAFDGRLTAPRAVALFGELKANDDYFAKHWAPAPKTDVTDADGVVYRYFSGRCLEFHPLANFGALNARIAAGDAEGTKLLADALAARGIYQRGGGVAWEYYFPFSGGRPPWISGMAQAVAAQAFARAANMLTEDTPTYSRAAHAAYAAIPGRLMTNVAAGPWIRLYSFQSTPVLNAQLQAVISLASYAADAEDTAAASLAQRMERAAAAMLLRFDTGFWTYYALPRDYSDLEYQQYVVQLLTKLAPDDQRFADAAKRFALYARQPPAFKLASAGVGQMSFWLSKPSVVSVSSAAGPSRRLSLGDGWHTVAWPTPKRPGIYPVKVAAVDRAGNRADFEALPLVRASAAGQAGSVRKVASAAAAQPAFFVGAGVADPSQGSDAQRAGLRAIRVGVAWPAGASAPDPGLVTALQRSPAGESIVVELAGLPTDDAGRAALAAYVVSLVQQVPAIRIVALSPGGAVPDYATALSAIADAVHAGAPGVQVGAVVDGSTAPKATAATLASLIVPDIVLFRPAPQAATGLWTQANLPQLLQAFGATPPPVVLDGLVAPSAAAVTSAACTPALAGVILDNLADAAPIASAAASAQRGQVVCPGVQFPVQTTALVYPDHLASGSPTEVQLGCVRDCLYLVTLDDASGRPVVAARGALRGGAAPSVVALPSAKLAPGSYRIDVRLVSQANPAPVLRLLSDPFPS
jgi:D-glucuronyl C5-epimerase C-terminus